MYGLVLILVGAVNLYYAIRFFKDPVFAENYIRKSPKAFLWKKLFGEEKAVKLTKRVFAPIGILLGIALVLVGFLLLGLEMTKNDEIVETNTVNVSENKFTFAELPIEMILPEGYTMTANEGKEWRASFGSYSLESNQKQGMQPTIWAIDFFSEASIKDFLKRNNDCKDSEPREDNPCSNGGYPGMEKYLGEKAAFLSLDKTYGDVELKKFNDRNYFTSKSRCSGDSCEIYKYTTYVGDTKVDINVISWDPNGQKPADELFREVKILDKNK
jgi:hypothetical protein